MTRPGSCSRVITLPSFAFRINKLRSDVSTINIAVEAWSFTTAASDATAGSVARHNSRPVAPSKRRTVEPVRTTTPSDPSGDWTNKGAILGTVPRAAFCGAGANQRATPVIASSAYAVPDEFVPTISKLERERRCASTGYLTSPIAARQLFPATIESTRGFSIGSIAFVLVFGSLTSTVPADENSPSFVVSAAIRQKYLPDGKSVSSYVVPLTTRSNTMSVKPLSRANCKRYRVTPGRGPQCKLTSCVCAFAESCLDKG